MATRFDGKVVIVTGAGSGNGRAIAFAFAESGATVVVADLIEQRAVEVCEEIKSAGYRCFPVVVDIASAEQVESTIERTYAEFGHVDVLINNAGIVRRASVVEVTEQDWDRIIDVNLKGPFLCAQAVAKRWIKDGSRGIVVNISSLNAHQAFPDTVPYCCSKGGVRMLTRGLAVALGPYGIRVNDIEPGTIPTGINRERLTAEVIAQDIAVTPLGRMGRSEDLVGAALFLASDGAEFITGASIVVDGGHSVLYGDPRFLPGSRRAAHPPGTGVLGHLL